MTVPNGPPDHWHSNLPAVSLAPGEIFQTRQSVALTRSGRASFDVAVWGEVTVVILVCSALRSPDLLSHQEDTKEAGSCR